MNEEQMEAELGRLKNANRGEAKRKLETRLQQQQQEGSVIKFFPFYSYVLCNGKIRYSFPRHKILWVYHIWSDLQLGHGSQSYMQFGRCRHRSGK